MVRPELQRAALARAVFIFVCGLGAAGLIIGVLDGPFWSLIGASETVGQTSYSADGRAYLTQFWQALPFLVVALAFVQLLAAAAADRGVGR